MALNIPNKEITKEQIVSTLLNEKDKFRISGVSEKVQNAAQEFINLTNEKRDSKILQITTTTETAKDNYLKDLDQTYKLLVEGCNVLFSKKKFLIDIKGRYGSCYDRPSVAQWLIDQPAKAKAIEVFSSELSFKGYKKPSMTISEWTVDHDDGMYSGGTVLFLSFDLE